MRSPPFPAVRRQRRGYSLLEVDAEHALIRLCEEERTHTDAGETENHHRRGVRDKRKGRLGIHEEKVGDASDGGDPMLEPDTHGDHRRERLRSHEERRREPLDRTPSQLQEDERSDHSGDIRIDDRGARLAVAARDGPRIPTDSSCSSRTSKMRTFVSTAMPRSVRSLLGHERDDRLKMLHHGGDDQEVQKERTRC